MLLQNLSVFSQYLVRQSGMNNADILPCFGRTAANNLNRLVSDAGMSAKTAIPDGYNPHYSWAQAQKSGGASEFKQIVGVATAVGALAGGKNAGATIAGTCTISAAGGLIVPLAATITAEATVTGAMFGKLEAAATIAAGDGFDASLGAITGMSITLSGTADISATPSALASASADIYVNQSEAYINQIVAGLWDAKITDHNESGSMGEAVAAAGTAGDPWTTTLPGSYTGDQAGAIIGQKILRLPHYIALKNS